MNYDLYLNEDEQRAWFQWGAPSDGDQRTLDVVIRGNEIESRESDQPRPQGAGWAGVRLQQFLVVGLSSEDRLRELALQTGVRAAPPPEHRSRYYIYHWKRNEREEHLYLLIQRVPPDVVPSKAVQLVQRVGRDFKFGPGGALVDVDRGFVLVPGGSRATRVSLPLLNALSLVNYEDIEDVYRRHGA
jgi:hypothetical protein